MPELKPHRLLCLTLLGLVLGGCDLLTGPGSGEFIYYFDQNEFENGKIERVDLRTGRMETVFDFDAPTTWAFDVHGSALFGATRTEGDGVYRIHEVDLCAMRFRWSLELGTDNEPRTMDGITFGSPGEISVSLDGNTLYVDEVFRDSAQGAVVLERATRRPKGFIGPFNHRTVGEIPPMPGYPDGATRVIGWRTDEPPGVLYFFHPTTLELLDSVPPADVGLSHFWSAEPSADGRTLYGHGSPDLFRYDLVNRSIVARHSPERWRPGEVAEAAGGKLVALDWSYNEREYPGSGLVYVFGPYLEPLGEIDVSTPVGGEPYGNQATRTQWLVIDPDGRTAYVAAVGLGLYGEQPARIFVLDLEALTVTKVIEVGGVFRVGRIVIPPEC